MLGSGSRALRSRRWVPTKTADLQFRPVDSRFATLDTSTLSFPAQLWIEGLTAPKIWYAKCLSMMRAVNDAQLNPGLAYMWTLSPTNSRPS
jgi:hypothetical protein